MSGRIVAGEFAHSVILTERPEWAEARWVAKFTAEGVREIADFATRPPADAWVDRQVRKFLGGRTVIPAPDGDGVVVLPHTLGAHARGGRLAVAVRVREASPLVGDLDVAADVVERIVAAERMLRDVAEMTSDAGLTDFARLAYAAAGMVVTLREWSACEALEETLVHLHDAPGAVEPTRHLALVPPTGGAA